VCARSQAGLDATHATTPCSPACASDSYCDPADSLCKPKWGCELNCASCPVAGGKQQQVSAVWSNLAAASGGLNDVVTAGGTLLGTDSTANTAEPTGGSSQVWLTQSGLGPSSSVGSSIGALMCASGVGATTPAAIAGFTSSPATYPASRVNLQIGDYLFRALGGNSPVFNLT
jgi:hypothetical protein